MRFREILEAKLDTSGWGATPYGTDINYFGLRVQMKPSMFLKLAAPLTAGKVNPDVERHMQSGGAIAYPMLDISIPESWREGGLSQPARVVGHEGRNRMTNWIKLHGDGPIQVNIRPIGLRRKNITDEMISALAGAMQAEDRNEIIRNTFDPASAR